jgi:hypothetical protein
MTAEVGVMNRRGVALAADSAVTVTLGEAKSKVYTSAEKLFQLSEHASLGVMIYEGADFLGVPWETIIRLYRRDRANAAFESLAEYADDFLEFLGTSRGLFPDETQQEYVRTLALGLFDHLRKRLATQVATKIEEEDKIDEAAIPRVFSSIVKEELATTIKYDLLDGLSDDFPAEVEKEYRQILLEAKDQVLESLPMSRSVSQKLLTLAAQVISRRRQGPLSSGVVIAGFGDQEHFPSLIEREFRGIAAGRVLFRHVGRLAIGAGAEALIAPFAQREMVSTFMEGIDPVLKAYIEESTDTLFHGVAKAILTRLCDQNPGLADQPDVQLSSALDRMIEELHQEWSGLQQQLYAGPVMDTVQNLPKDELAEMAEALVNLTKFKRRVSDALETVGGPIDVAVITKGDGFVWIKRKHYFRPELNQRFVAKYYTGGRT